ncbi:hypothetical protein O0L34_g17148 [Tuta absoluta]|nr:hypothetical protein O0L34_g17148 [Tuta absoluta]
MNVQSGERGAGEVISTGLGLGRVIDRSARRRVHAPRRPGPLRWSSTDHGTPAPGRPRIEHTRPAPAHRPSAISAQPQPATESIHPHDWLYSCLQHQSSPIT